MNQFKKITLQTPALMGIKRNGRGASPPDPAEAGTFCYTTTSHTWAVSARPWAAQPPPNPVSPAAATLGMDTALQGKPRDAQGCRKPILSLGASSILNHICKYELKDIKPQKWPQLLARHRSQRGSQAEQVLDPRHQQDHTSRTERGQLLVSYYKNLLLRKRNIISCL